MSLKDKIPNLPNLSKIGTNKIKVYAFVGPSGTGKSYRAQMVAGEKDTHFIIDDGLLIKENEVIAGIYDDAERCHGRKPTLNEINHGVKSNSGQKYGGWTDFAGKNNSYKKRSKDPRRK